MNYYNPETGFYIPNPLPKTKGWAGSTDKPLPAYNTTTEQCRFVSGEWAVELIPGPPVEELATSLNQDVGQYIYTRYDAGTQASFQAIYSDEDTPLEAKTAIKGMWDWVRSVMTYYYTCKAEVLAGTSTEWDFGQFDTTDPGLNLADFV